MDKKKDVLLLHKEVVVGSDTKFEAHIAQNRPSRYTVASMGVSAHDELHHLPPTIEVTDISDQPSQKYMHRILATQGAADNSAYHVNTESLLCMPAGFQTRRLPACSSHLIRCR